MPPAWPRPSDNTQAGLGLCASRAEIPRGQRAAQSGGIRPVCASQARAVLGACSVCADGAGGSTREIQKHDLQNFETIVPGVLILE